LTLHRLREIGVHGFVEMNQSLEILEEAIFEVASGGTYFTALWSRIQEQLRSDPFAFTKFLSTREQEILRLVATGRTSKAIAAQLGLSLRSVETYRYRMMRKLGIQSLAGLIEFGLRLQLVAPPSPGKLSY
jgi:DNA-binding NarL/FixJ family response regulator